MNKSQEILKFFEAGKEGEKTTDHTTTDGSVPHYHKFEIDQEGNGKTLSTEGKDSVDHEHEIKTWSVLSHKDEEGKTHTHAIEDDVIDIVHKLAEDFKGAVADLKKLSPDSMKKTPSGDYEVSFDGETMFLRDFEELHGSAPKAMKSKIEALAKKNDIELGVKFR
jgi:outer membrane lipoprotein-sorting protein